MSHPKFLS